MLKRLDLNDVPTLFELMQHPEVFPYVREKAKTVDEFYFLTKQVIEKEQVNETISRTICSEYGEPVGSISLYHIQHKTGFLNTWLGQPYFGMGYSQYSKEQFFNEVFYETDIETIYLKIRKDNIRSLKSTEKLPYAKRANDTYKHVYQQLNQQADIFDLYVVEKYNYISHITLDTDVSEHPTEVIVG